MLDAVREFGARLWRGIKRVGNRLRAENENPTVAFRDWLKIIISGAAIVGLFLTTRQLGIQTRALQTQTDQLRTQGDQLKVQANQLTLQVRAANTALAGQLSAQLTAIENAREVIGPLEKSFEELMEFHTQDVFDGKELIPAGITRAGELIAHVRRDREVVEAATHGLPFEAFVAVRKFYADTLAVVFFENDLAGLQTRGMSELQWINSPIDQEYRKQNGYAPAKLRPRFGDAMGDQHIQTTRDLFSAVKALQDAEEATRKRWAEVEKAIKD
ncbi:hypothetical protein [Bradyrhizobium guangzhouense]|uniref:hypothetical protein n=1 Tax=Bradyrhizobium guangzhouense TaxID=1325095 RepID=UPI001009B1D2|nr:hypothetical protein [Bradyrhizobium guangzhouense]RXH15231.1 hypothetical protein EAS54_19335 [Bradyrhizobium guangzhouense]